MHKSVIRFGKRAGTSLLMFQLESHEKGNSMVLPR